jgi:hypothetical protein
LTRQAISKRLQYFDPPTNKFHRCHLLEDMVSLPNFHITDTYKVYKSRERTFTSWLRATGEKLGVKLPNSQNRTERIEAAKHDVSISDMQKLVNLCIQRGEALPDEVRRNLNDAVSKRKEAAGFYKPKGDKKSDETHSYYLQVLQWALEQFKDLKATTAAMGTNLVSFLSNHV